MHLQAAMMDENYVAHQFNQPSIDTMEVPYQHLAPMIRQLCCRNRTRVAANTRGEVQELHEIDMEATEPARINDEDRMILDLTRTGAAWTRTAAYWAGQAESKTCQLCKKGDEPSWFFWTCKSLNNERDKIDTTLADLDPELLPMPVRHGIAPALKAKGATTYWGSEEDPNIPDDQRKLFGCCMEKEINESIRDEMQKLTIEITAREYIQYKDDEGGNSKLPTPGKEEDNAPEDINVYTDGSLHNPTSRHWQVGGMGIFWPDRT